MYILWGGFIEIRTGRIEGRVEGAIKIYKKMEASREDTIKNIMEDFSLDKEVADKYVEEYY